jgi:DNA-binding MarR family transcriptional regulator
LTLQVFSTKHGDVTPSPSSDAKRLFGELWLVINEITRGIDAELKPFGLTHAQFQVLLHVDMRPGLLQRELTERLRVTSGNVSMLVTRLENAGLLIRVPEGAAHHLHLTPAGKALFESLRPTREHFISELFSRLSPEEIGGTADSLRKLRSP